MLSKKIATQDARNVFVNAGASADRWNGGSTYSGALSGVQHSEDDNGKARWASNGPRR